MRSKTRELGAFTIGIAMVIGILSLLMFTVVRSPEANRTTALVVVLTICASLVLVGGLTIALKSRAMIIVAVAALSIVLLLDTLLSFNVVKAAVSVLDYVACATNRHSGI